MRLCPGMGPLDTVQMHKFRIHSHNNNILPATHTITTLTTTILTTTMPTMAVAEALSALGERDGHDLIDRADNSVNI